jgi:hypothetical protein
MDMIFCLYVARMAVAVALLPAAFCLNIAWAFLGLVGSICLYVIVLRLYADVFRNNSLAFILLIGNLMQPFA